MVFVPTWLDWVHHYAKCTTEQGQMELSVEHSFLGIFQCTGFVILSPYYCLWLQLWQMILPYEVGNKIPILQQ